MNSIQEIIEKNKKLANFNDVTLISQNCIGGIIYHDLNKQFISPTINLYFEAKDFIKFCNNLNYYLNCKLVICENTPIITGILDDLKLYFLHYETPEMALSKWNERLKRINKNKIFIISTDRDGFDEQCFNEFSKLPYKKALITCNEKWKNYDFVIYLDNYKDLNEVPDTIPQREFYLNEKIIKLINEV